MKIHKITSSVDNNKWQKRLNSQLNEPTNKNIRKVPKVVNPTNENILVFALKLNIDILCINNFSFHQLKNFLKVLCFIIEVFINVLSTRFFQSPNFLVPKLVGTQSLVLTCLLHGCSCVCIYICVKKCIIDGQIPNCMPRAYIVDFNACQPHTEIQHMKIILQYRQLSADIKMKNCKIKSIQPLGSNKTGINFRIFV